MASFLFVASRGSNDPTMATLPFENAFIAVKEGHEARIALIAEGVVLMKDSVAGELQGLGCQSFKDALSKVIEHNIPIYV